MISLRNPFLLIGLVLIALPVILHLLMRAKPKRLIFPALQLIQQRRKNSTRRLRLRHLWLLLLRVGVIALLVLALVRPVLPAARYGLVGRELWTLLGIVAVAVAVYFGMERRWKNRQLPGHELRTNRSYLRGGLGVIIPLLLILLVGWPYANRVRGEFRNPVATDLPVAAVFVFDTSLSMDYRQNKTSRLEAAAAMANDHSANFPDGSRAAVVETVPEPNLTFFNSPRSWEGRIGKLKPKRGTVPLEQAIRSALVAHADDRAVVMEEQSDLPETDRADRFLREIYVFTDLAGHAWRDQISDDLKQSLADDPSIHLYVVDVGVENPVNYGLVGLRLPSPPEPGTVASEGWLAKSISAEAVYRGGDAGRRRQTVDVSVIAGKDDPKLEVRAGDAVVRDSEFVRFEDGNRERVAFDLKRFDDGGPFFQGSLRFSAATGESVDGLAFDNEVHFTLQRTSNLSQPWILIVGPNDGSTDNLERLLAPAQLRQDDLAPYRVDVIEPSELGEAELDNYATVCLVNVPSPFESDWQRLDAYVRDGGGLAVFLGSKDIEPEAYGSEAANQVLPIESLLTVSYFDPKRTFDVLEPGDAVFAGFLDPGDDPLQSAQTGAIAYFQNVVRITRAWSAKPRGDASVIARYSAWNRPAILSRSVGEGRVLLMTTGIDSVNGFNDLTRDWPFLSLVWGMLTHLNGSSEQLQTNYVGREEITLRNDDLFHRGKLAQLRLDTPSGQQPFTVEPALDALPVDSIEKEGHYRIWSLSPDAGDTDNNPSLDLVWAFSVNAPDAESDLTRLTIEELTERLGAEQYGYARTPADLDRIVTSGRIHTEVFPAILTLLILMFVGEHLIANYFYRREIEEGPTKIQLEDFAAETPRPTEPITRGTA